MKLSLGKYETYVSLVLVSALLLSAMPLVQFIVPALAEPVHDVAVLSVTPECSFAYTTWGTAGGSPNLKIEVMVENQGSEAENFSVTVWYINGTRGTIATKNVTLAAGENTTLTFSWTIKNTPYGTGSVTVGKYTICANATVVSGETDVADNTLVGPVFTLKFEGDVNGDCFVGGFDATVISINWWTNVPGSC